MEKMKSKIAAFAVLTVSLIACAFVLCGCEHIHKPINTYDYVATVRVEDNDKLDLTAQVLYDMLVEKGYPEAEVEKNGGNAIYITVPSVDEWFDFFGEDSERVKIYFVLSSTNEIVITTDDIITASVTFNSNGYGVSLELTEQGQEKLYSATSEHIGEAMNIISAVGDDNTVISSPIINTAVSGETVIEGSFSYDSAKQLADRITFCCAFGSDPNAYDMSAYIIPSKRCVLCGKKMDK